MEQEPLTNGVEIVRLNPDGSLDTTYGNGGHVRLKVPSFNTNLSDISLQADGKLLVAVVVTIARGQSDSGIYRLSGTGELDVSFDGDGYRSIDFGVTDWISSVVATSNGKVALSGQSTDAQSDTSSWVVQLQTDGTLDISFDGDSGIADGYVRLNNFYLSDFVSVSDGFVMVGQDTNGVGSIMKLDSIGRVATSFATNGQGVFPVSDGNGGYRYSWFSYVVPRADGGFIAFGSISNNSLGEIQLLVFDASGAPDTNFDGSTGIGNGLVTFPQPVTGKVFSGAMVSVDGDGYVLTGNIVYINGGEPKNIQPVIRRITSAGIYDASYGSNGQIQVADALSNTTATWGIASRNGGVVVAGSHQAGTVFGRTAFVAKIVEPQSVTTSTSSTTSTSTTIAPPTNAPLTTVAPTSTTTAPPNSPVAGSVVVPPKVVVGKLISRTSLLKQFALTVPKGGKVAMTVATTKTCKVVGTSVKGLSKGTCSVKFSIAPSKGAAKKYVKVLKVT
jgi:uncharacterized delta-60 repeat protein